jgi:hypothetical protein
LKVRELIDGLASGEIVEEYPEYPKGHSILLLQKCEDNKPVHTVWGIPAGHQKPAVLVTAYRPNPEKWDRTFKRRV